MFNGHMDATTSLANRTADVSDALDNLINDARLKQVWDAAQRIYLQDDVSFLVAFERALILSAPVQ